MEKTGYFEIGMDHFALETDSLFKALNNKTLHRNFMGYTSQLTHLLIGLGASSISDTWSGFSQNIKEVEAYCSHIENRVLPLSKGHTLTKEDLIIRQHILNIMCKFETSWEDPATHTDSLFQGIERMKEMEKDGLVVIENKRLYITPEGRPFLRNICLALDAKLWKEKPTSQIFSATI